MYVMTCERRFPSVVGAHLESVIFPPDTQGHGEFLHFYKKNDFFFWGRVYPFFFSR